MPVLSFIPENEDIIQVVRNLNNVIKMFENAKT